MCAVRRRGRGALCRHYRARCAHHAREHGDKLAEVAEVVVDETHKLTATPTPSSDDA